MTIDFQILAYEETQLGPLCLRRRKTLSQPAQWVTEITLNHEFLMSSLHTHSERMLAAISLERVPRSELRVLVGGLGLGYTAQAVLESGRAKSVEVVELLAPVIGWTADGLTPLAADLNADRRLIIRQGSIFEQLLAPVRGGAYDAILIDIDHSPEDRLSAVSCEFYSPAGLMRAAAHLAPGGVFALWSYAASTPLLNAMGEALDEVRSHPVEYHNRHVDESYVDWLYTGVCRVQPESRH